MNVNRDWWDERAALHGQDQVYDTASFLAGSSTLYDLDRGVLGDLAGQDVIHLQCHTGMDTLSLLRAGARRVTGVDFSAVAVAKATGMAEAAGLADRARFLVADVLAVPASLHDTFDVCYASRGVLCWIGDLTGWMRTAAAVLRPAGRLVLIDAHPLFNMADRVEPLHDGVAGLAEFDGGVDDLDRDPRPRRRRLVGVGDEVVRQDDFEIRGPRRAP